MKRLALLAVLALATLAIAAPLVSHADDEQGEGKSKSHHEDHGKGKGEMKTQYLVLSPHTDAECLQTIDNTEKMGSLAKWRFGCMDGDHTGYLITTATDAQAALAMVPASVRGKARAVKLHTFTPAELKAAHTHMQASK